MPYPVVSGYLSGVGLIIIASQMPKWLGVYGNGGFWFALMSPQQWRVPSLIVGAVAMMLMWLAPRITSRVPAVVIAMVGSTVTYWLLGLWDPALHTLEGNSLLVGPLGGASMSGGSADALGALSNFFSSLRQTNDELRLIESL